MKVTVNGDGREFDGESLSLGEVLEALGLGGHPVVVEHNGSALLPGEQAGTVVRDGDQLEIVRVVAGG